MARSPRYLVEAIAALAASPLLARLDDRERQRLLACLEIHEVASKTHAHGDGKVGRHLCIARCGSATRCRAEFGLRKLGPGDSFGELALLGARHGGETVMAELAEARLSAAGFAELERNEPRLAEKTLTGVAAAPRSIRGRHHRLRRGRPPSRRRFVSNYPDHVPSTWPIRDFIGGSGFGY